MAKAKGVSVGADGAVWCVTQDGFLHKRVGSAWQKNRDAGNVEEVAVGHEGLVLCRNRSGQLFRANDAGNNPQWTPIGYPGTGLRSISAAGDGTIWIINGQGQPATMVNGQWLAHLDVGTAVDIAVGNSNRVCFLDGSGRLFEPRIIGGGVRWVESPRPENSQVKLTAVSCGSNGLLWAATDKDELYKRGATDKIWRKNERGRAVQISTGASHLVWCVNREGNIFHAETNRYDTGWIQVANPA